MFCILISERDVLSEAYPSRAPGLIPVFGGVCVAHLFSFLCFVCPRPVSGVSNVAGVPVLTILDYPFGFL